jgi:CRP/FNR family transcriptional regulator, anaerobic regulatory protein
MRREKAECSTCVNENCFIKKHIQHPDMKNYLEHKHTILVKKSQQFIIEGSPVHGLYFIYKGKVKILKTGIYGREQIVRLTNNGNIVGFRGFGTGKKYLIGATALEESILCNFSTEIVMKMLHTIPEVTFDLMLFYAEELNKSENDVRKIAQMTVRERVVDTLNLDKRMVF